MILYFVIESIKDYILNVSSIPRAANDECLVSATHRARFGVCTCNEHCSWDLCRLLEPPDDCLLGTNSEWKWDNLKNAYVAQITDGMYDRLDLRTFMCKHKTLNLILHYNLIN